MLSPARISLALGTAAAFTAIAALPLIAFADTRGASAGSSASAAPPAVTADGVPKEVSLTPVPAHRTLKIAVYKGPGAPEENASQALTALARDPQMAVETVSIADIQSGKLSGYDLLVMPGGSGGGQGNALGPEGREKVRRFVGGGGGFIGICGGAYVATGDYKWSLGLLNAHVLDKAHWARGHGPVAVAPTPAGKPLLGANVDAVTIIYWQGPILAPANDPRLPAYDEWAKFTGEIANNGAPHGIMPGTTAVAAAPFGAGRVVCFSPHPEKTAWQSSLLQHAALWAPQTPLSPPAPTAAAGSTTAAPASQFSTTGKPASE